MTEEEWLKSTDPTSALTWMRDERKLSTRKARLFSVACFRRILPALRAREQLDLLEAAEEYADRSMTETDLAVAHVEALEWDGRGLPCGDPDASQAAILAGPASWRLWEMSLRNAHGDAERVWQEARKQAKLVEKGKKSPARGPVVSQAAYAIAMRAAANASVTASEARAKISPDGLRAERDRLLEEEATLLHCIFGPLPFRPITIAPVWLTRSDGLVVSLAQTAYEQRSLPEGVLDQVRLAVLADALEEAGCTDAAILSHLRGPGPHVRGCWALDLILGRE